MAWVQMAPAEAVSGDLREVYHRVRERTGFVPNIARVQSLRPRTMARGLDLYCQIMDDATGLPRRERVLIAIVVSRINGCWY
jgi:uncharacterized peroxidase-related enzyme